MTTALEGGEGSASRPGSSLPPGKTRYPLYRRLGSPQGRSGQVRKISPPPGFDPRTVQPVASRYIDYATRRTASPVGRGKWSASCSILFCPRETDPCTISEGGWEGGGAGLDLWGRLSFLVLDGKPSTAPRSSNF